MKSFKHHYSILRARLAAQMYGLEAGQSAEQLAELFDYQLACICPEYCAAFITLMRRETK